MTLVIIACCVAWSSSCDDSDGTFTGYDLDITPTLIIWANLMPTFPPPPDRVHAIVTAEFRNLSEDPVVIDVVRMAVRSAESGQLLHLFRLQQTTDWDGYLPPGETGRGEWRKADAAMSGRIVCDESVVGTLWVTGSLEDGRRIHVPAVELEPTTLACVY
jgi:hypothetical protein